MTKTSKILLGISVAVSLVFLTLFGTLYGTTNASMQSYKRQLNYIYQNQFYSLCDSVNNIENNLSKLLVSNDKDQQERYLTEIVSLCEMSQNSLSSLPIEHTSLENTYKFVNQLGGYCFSLNQKLLDKKELTLDDIESLDNLHESSMAIKYELNRLSNLVNSGYSIVDNVKDPNVSQNKFSGEFKGLYGDTIEYPTLIYDGPFSDSQQNKKVKGLPDGEITQVEAEIKMKDWFKGYDIEYLGETSSDISTFDFAISKTDISGYAKVTKNGGMLLMFGTSLDMAKDNRTTKECEILAVNFAEKLGYKNTKVVWSAESDGFVYCNLTFVEKDVIVYPDMIKIKVRKDGEIAGIEAKSYILNHIDRKDLLPTISKEEAQEGLDKFLDVLNVNLCIIPGEFVGENLSWEFKCLYDQNMYYVYVDAKTGKELKTMKVVDTDDGELLM